MKFIALIGMLFPTLWGISASAQTLQSYCYSDPKNFKIVQGLKVDTKFPIASVSKLVTSYWAISAKGANYKFTTAVYVTPVDKGEFDIHFQGSRDPYFGQEKLHYIISKLNEKGITKVRNLTFDENFNYLKELDIEKDPLKETRLFPWKNYYVSPVGPKKTLIELKSGLIDTYQDSVKHLAKSGIKLISKVSFDVKEINFLSSKHFVPTNVTKSYTVNSAPLYKLLKEMNRNSNNFAAVEIFKFLGGRQAFSPFIKKQLGFGTDEIDFYEGSGNNLGVLPTYNKATCRALLVIFK